MVTKPIYSIGIPSERSPLRYPGGKTRAAKKIAQLIPNDLTEIVSPFFGGGSTEIYLQAYRPWLTITASDLFAPLVNFWNRAINDPKRIADITERNHWPMTKDKFYLTQKEYDTYTTDDLKAAAFYALNRASYSGTTLSGGYSPGAPRFTPTAIAKLRALHLPHIAQPVRCSHWLQTLSAHRQAFAYLDPPYLNNERLYGKRGDMHTHFDHQELADALTRRDTSWLLHYNDHPTIRELYRDFNIITTEWSYGMRTDKGTSSEIIILNYTPPNTL